ncbi:hypothetical protein [Listeria seeligeri]|uniref:hypothetical protein n=1 Tax=Listeria seeligeri TaxID=1640 RepID=UPI0022EBC4E6|nr:hypothetical protein [Listeria seeligeri]
MNAQRRKAITKSIGVLKEQQEIIEALMEEEQEYLDNIPENLEGSSRYEKAEEAIQDLEGANDLLEDALDYLESATE